MRRRVVVSADATVALRRARDWLTQPGSGVAGRQRWVALRDVGRRLLDTPDLGAASHDHPDQRQHVVHGYRVIYRVEGQLGEDGTGPTTLRIVAVLGPGQP